jgi:hypothetical protein
VNVFFVVRVKYLKDGSIKRSEMMQYQTEQEAMAKFHTNLGADMSDDTLAGSMCVVLNAWGGDLATSSWGDIPHEEGAVEE